MQRPYQPKMERHGLSEINLIIKDWQQSQLVLFPYCVGGGVVWIRCISKLKNVLPVQHINNIQSNLVRNLSLIDLVVDLQVHTQVIVKLKAIEYGMASDLAAVELRDRVEKQLENLALVTARDRTEPTSSSEMTPSDQTTGTALRRPDFDESFFVDLIPDEPSPGVPDELD